MCLWDPWICLVSFFYKSKEGTESNLQEPNEKEKHSLSSAISPTHFINIDTKKISPILKKYDRKTLKFSDF